VGQVATDVHSAAAPGTRMVFFWEEGDFFSTTDRDSLTT
jgi:hypothetical protein